jgi:hypothetical protein
MKSFGVRMLAWALLFCVNFAAASEITKAEAEKINKRACNKNALIIEGHGLLNTSDLGKEEYVAGCVKTMMSRYERGLPNYATNTEREVDDFVEHTDTATRAHRSGRIVVICMSTYTLYNKMIENKSNGVAKWQAIEIIRSAEASNKSSLLASAFFTSGLPYEMVSVLYSHDGIPSAEIVSTDNKMFYDACVSIFEKLNE